MKVKFAQIADFAKSKARGRGVRRDRSKATFGADGHQGLFPTKSGPSR